MLQPKIAKKNSTKLFFWRFKVIDVDKIKKPVTSVCTDSYMSVLLSATVFILNEPIAAN